MSTDNEEEEEETTEETKAHGNAYFAGVYDTLDRIDGYGGNYRGVPTPHGGAQAVHPSDTIGTTLCWCGQKYGHDWPGKKQGLRHPRNPLGNTDVEGATMSTTATRTLRRRDIRAYHRSLQDWIMLMQEKGLRLRAGRNSIVVYPPDGTNAITVYARNSEAQLRSLQQWQAQHVPDGEVDVKKLAEAINDPTEHPAKNGVEPVQDLPEDVKDTVEELLEVADWKPWVPRDGAGGGGGGAAGKWEVTTIEEQQVWRCIRCWDTDHRYVTFNRRSLGGHTRQWHTDTTDIHGPESRVKAVETNKVNKISEQVKAAIDLLAETVGYDVTGGEQVEAIKKELNTAATELSATTQSMQEWKKRAEEAEAKLALMKEVFGT